jgi:hypothetical protein
MQPGNTLKMVLAERGEAIPQRNEAEIFLLAQTSSRTPSPSTSVPTSTLTLKGGPTFTSRRGDCENHLLEGIFSEENWNSQIAMHVLAVKLHWLKGKFKNLGDKVLFGNFLKEN